MATQSEQRRAKRLAEARAVIEAADAELARIDELVEDPRAQR